MKVSAQLYSASSMGYDGLPQAKYPFQDKDALVTARGRICMMRKRSTSRPSSPIRGSASRQSMTEFGLVSFVYYDLVYTYLEPRTLLTIDNPFHTKVSPMS